MEIETVWVVRKKRFFPFSDVVACVLLNKEYKTREEAEQAAQEKRSVQSTKSYWYDVRCVNYLIS